MRRRDFLKTGAQAAVVGAAASVPAGPGLAAARPTGATAATATPAVLKSYTAADHRRRLDNIGACQQAIRTCLRKHLVTSYLPAQCCYNLGEYPCRKPWDPGDYDERELDRLKEHGIQLIQVFDEWNDSLRLFGGNKHTAINPAGFRRFIDMVHRRGMKMLTYTSTGSCNGPIPISVPSGRPRVSAAPADIGTWPCARRRVPAGGPICCRG